MKGRLIQFARDDWALLVALIGVAGLTAMAYPSLPAEVPIHWNWRGEVDGYASRLLASVTMPVGATLSYLVVALLLAVDPRQRGFDESKRAMSMLRMATPAFLLALHMVLVITWLTDGSIDFVGLLYAGVGVLYAVIGNFMTKVRPNYVVGIRLPWTLEDEVVWRKTHRMAGPIWFVGGLSLMVTPLLGASLQFVYFIVISVVIIAAPSVYAYRLYHDRHGEQA